MEPKDFIGIAALIVSGFSLAITLTQKRKETQRTIRKTLSDTLESITKINIETSKLKSLGDFTSEGVIDLRRNYNSQRRILIANADFLMKEYDHIATEIDCNILAGAYTFIGDQEMAKYYWKKTIEKSFSSPIKHMNLRGYGTFLFRNNEPENGRKAFEDAINIPLLENDQNRALLADTYIMLSDFEKELDNLEYKEYLNKAIEQWYTIKDKYRQNEIHERIKKRLPESSSIFPS